MKQNIFYTKYCIFFNVSRYFNKPNYSSILLFTASISIFLPTKVFLHGKINEIPFSQTKCFSPYKGFFVNYDHTDQPFRS